MTNLFAKIHIMLVFGTFFTSQIGCLANYVFYQNLNDDWKLKELGSSQWIDVTVPSTVQLELINNQQFQDPYIDDNLLDFYSLQTKDWEYQKTFSILDSAILELPVIELVFEGIDTHADVYLNGKQLQSVNNMHRSWAIDVKNHILSSNNTIKVLIYSAAKHDIQAAQDLLPIVLPYNYSFSRKSAYLYGWDWGPRIVTAGIWQPVTLRAYDRLRMQSIYLTHQQIDGSLKYQKIKITAIVTFQYIQPGQYQFEIMNKDEQSFYLQTHFKIKKPLFNQNKKKLVTKKFSFEIQDPQLWWPWNLGEPYLYTLQLTAFHREICLIDDTQTVQLGIRTIDLIQENDSPKVVQGDASQSFKFRVNGYDTFMKGANYIPPDMFMPRAYKDQSVYNKTINDALAGNFNMLRLWGGGQFEYDIFYDICDEKGIVIWHDFMFACALYPGTPDMVENVKIEIQQNVRRLRNHPSIGFWNGNNEIWEGWNEWDWQKPYNQEQKEQVWGWYVEIFQKTIPDVLAQQDPRRSYIHSSPLASYQLQNQTNFNHGDLHYWGVWAGGEDLQLYEFFVGRFNSEYGMQAMPPLSSIQQFITQEKDRNLDSLTMKLHERHLKGWQLLDQYLKEYIDKNQLNFTDYIYQTNILQSYAIGLAIEAQRSAKPYCMGTLFWQLNDVWPVVSWASVDYYGEWQALQYRARELYSNVQIFVQLRNNNSFSEDQQVLSSFDIVIINDNIFEIKSGTLHVELWNIQTSELVEKTEFSQINLEVNSELQLTNKKFQNQIDCRTHLIFAQFEYENSSDGKINTVENYKLYVRPNELNLGKKPLIIMDYDDLNNTLIISSDQLLLWFYIYSQTISNIQLSRNYLMIFPKTKYIIKVDKIHQVKEIIQQLKFIFYTNNRINELQTHHSMS